MKLVYQSAPAYSMVARDRRDYLREYDRTPGPGAYPMPKLDRFKQQAPQYTMTSRRYAKFTSPLDDQYQQ